MKGTKYSVKNNKFLLEQKLTENILYSIDNKKDYFSITFFKKPHWVSGISSLCKDNKHIFFLDYDDVLLEIVEQDLEKLNLIIPLAPFYIFTTKQKKVQGKIIGNYHIISLLKLSPAIVSELQRETHCDRAYYSMPKRTPYKGWVLRIGEKGTRHKPLFLGVYGEYKYTEGYTRSNAHLKFLKKAYNNILDIDYKDLDNLSKITINMYQTINRVN